MKQVARFWLIVICGAAVIGRCQADETSTTPSSMPGQTGERPTFNGILQRSASNQKMMAAKLEEALSRLGAVSNSGDAAEIKRVIEQTKKKLAEMKDINGKSCALLDKAEKHIAKIRQRSDAKTSELIDQPDSDFDDVIWAF